MKQETNVYTQNSEFDKMGNPPIDPDLFIKRALRKWLKGLNQKQ